MTACNEYFARYRALPVWSSEFDEQQDQEYEDKLASTEESLVADFSAYYPRRTEVLCRICFKGIAHTQQEPCLCTAVRCNFCTAPRERIFAPAVRKRFRSGEGPAQCRLYITWAW